MDIFLVLSRKFDKEYFLTLFLIAILFEFNLICLPISTCSPTEKINIRKKHNKCLEYCPLKTKSPVTSKNIFVLKLYRGYNADIGLLFKN